MKYIIYLRASTDSQAYDQQLRTIENWVRQNNIIPDMTFEEKESGSKKHTERVLINAINWCKPGDTIIASEFSRLSRSMGDLASVVELCVEKGVNVSVIKENVNIRGNEPTDLTTKMMVMIFGLAAEIELSNIRSRTQSGLNVIKDRIKKDGYAIGKKSGRRFEKLGNPSLSETTMKGVLASSTARRKKKTLDKNFRQTYELASLLEQRGLMRKDIAVRLNQSGYKTPMGCEFIGATVSRLLLDGKKLLKKV